MMAAYLLPPPPPSRRRRFTTALLPLLLLAAPATLLSSSSSSFLQPVEAVYEEDAGRLDFRVETAGHGAPISFVAVASVLAVSASSAETDDDVDDSTANDQQEREPNNNNKAAAAAAAATAAVVVVITSDAASEGYYYDAEKPTSSCYVSGRDVDTGNLLWRRNVCSRREQQRQQQQSSFVRAITTSSSSSSNGGSEPAGGGGRQQQQQQQQQPAQFVHTLDAAAGYGYGIVRTWNALSGNLVWEERLSMSTDTNTNGPRTSSSSSTSTTTTTTTGTIWTFVADGVEYVAAGRTGGGGGRNGSGGSATTTTSIFVAATGERVVVGNGSVGASTKNYAAAAAAVAAAANNSRPPTPSSSESLLPVDASCPELSSLAMSLRNDDSTNRNSFSYKWDRSGGGGEKRDDGVVVVVADLGLSDGDSASSMTLLSCSEDRAVVLVTTSRGTTMQITFTAAAATATAGSAADEPTVAMTWETKWTAEEGLASISSALLLDTSHYVGDLNPQDGTRLLEFGSRLRSQWQALVALLPTTSSSNRGEGSVRDRVHTFGFVKTAALVSRSSDRLYGMDTVGPNRGKIRYSIDLPRNVEWHRMVHGGPSSTKLEHGINGGTHSRDVLVLSLVDSSGSSSKTLEWTCVDAANGVVHSRSSVTLPSAIAQVVPTPGAPASACRQGAMLLLRDGSVFVVPDNDDAKELARIQLRLAPNGFYAHYVNKEASTFETYLLTESLQSQLAGSVAFQGGERVVLASYPKRDEVRTVPARFLADILLHHASLNIFF